ncbi:hypothetical protein D1872_325460 [compost metagenome]
MFYYRMDLESIILAAELRPIIRPYFIVHKKKAGYACFLILSIYFTVLSQHDSLTANLNRRGMLGELDDQNFTLIQLLGMM